MSARVAESCVTPPAARAPPAPTDHRARQNESRAGASPRDETHLRSRREGGVVLCTSPIEQKRDTRISLAMFTGRANMAIEIRVSRFCCTVGEHGSRNLGVSFLLCGGGTIEKEGHETRLQSRR